MRFQNIGRKIAAFEIYFYTLVAFERSGGYDGHEELFPLVFVFLSNTFYQSSGSFLIHFSSESSK